MNQDFVSLASIARVVQDIAEQQRSGFLHLETDEGQPAYIGFLQGRLMTIRYRRVTRGEQALTYISQHQALRYHFEATQEIQTDRLEGLDTPTLISRLAPGVSYSTESQTTGPGRTNTPALSDAKIAALRQDFVSVLGPIADYVFQDALAKAQHPSDFLKLLTDEIPDAASASEFAARARAILAQGS